MLLVCDRLNRSGKVVIQPMCPWVKEGQPRTRGKLTLYSLPFCRLGPSSQLCTYCQVQELWPGIVKIFVFRISLY